MSIDEAPRAKEISCSAVMPISLEAASIPFSKRSLRVPLSSLGTVTPSFWKEPPHDRIGTRRRRRAQAAPVHGHAAEGAGRSEEHTSELQSRQYLVCRLLLEKKTITLVTPPYRITT